MNNIVIIGFMGVGKGTTTRAISKRYNLMSIDTDDLIESMENRKIKTIFKDDGEEYFRELEKKVAKWLENSVKDTIISTGGGFYKVPNLKKIGKVVLLDASFDFIYDRITKSVDAKKKLAKRPLFNSYSDAKRLYETRLQDYKAIADTIIDVENRDLNLITTDIYEKLLKTILV